MYDNAGQLLLAVAQLFTNFKEYSTVPRIAELITKVASIKSQLYDRIMREFEHLTELGVASALGSPAKESSGSGGLEPSLVTLRQACEVVDALEPDVRERLVKIFCRSRCGRVAVCPCVLRSVCNGRVCVVA